MLSTSRIPNTLEGFEVATRQGATAMKTCAVHETATQVSQFTYVELDGF